MGRGDEPRPSAVPRRGLSDVPPHWLRLFLWVEVLRPADAPLGASIVQGRRVRPVRTEDRKEAGGEDQQGLPTACPGLLAGSWEC